jgi:hypothetical protein
LYQNGELIDDTELGAGDNLLTRSFAWIKNNSAEQDGYLIVLDEDINIAAGFTIGSGAGATSSTGNGSNNKNLKITLEGLDQARTIKLVGANAGALFTVYGGTGDLPELILGENITLSGDGNNTNPDDNKANKSALVVVGGSTTTYMSKLTMNAGSRITGNNNDSTGNKAGGVMVLGGGTFVMNGGVIDNNKITGARYIGGAVLVLDSFMMSGGDIAKNTSNSGGAVLLPLGGTVIFKKTGGIIYGAEANAGPNANTPKAVSSYAGSPLKERANTADVSVNLDFANTDNWD